MGKDRKLSLSCTSRNYYSSPKTAIDRICSHACKMSAGIISHDISNVWLIMFPLSVFEKSRTEIASQGHKTSIDMFNKHFHGDATPKCIYFLYAVLLDMNRASLSLLLYGCCVIRNRKELKGDVQIKLIHKI